jgi:PAS domain-containing protein
MGWLSYLDWQEIAAAIGVLTIVSGWYLRWHIKIRRWVMETPTKRQLLKRIEMLERTIETKDNIDSAFNMLRAAIENGMQMVAEKVDRVDTGMTWIKSDVEQLRGDHLVFRTDIRGDITECNFKMAQEFGRPISDMLGRNFVNLMLPGARGPFMKRYREAIEDRRNIEEGVHLSGRSYTLRARPVNNNGSGLMGYSGVLIPTP